MEIIFSKMDQHIITRNEKEIKERQRKIAYEQQQIKELRKQNRAIKGRKLMDLMH